MADGQVVFEVQVDSKNAKAGLKDITHEVEKETKNWDKAAEQSTENIGNSFSSMLKKIAAGFSIAKIGQKLLQLGKEAVQLASDLEEVQNVVDVTFGDNAKEIDSWAKSAAASFGLTETQAKRFASTMGAMMKSSGLAGDQIVEMSTDLAGLAADMASFYNLDFDTAFQKIRSGISGETEPLKQLGINMSVANLNAFALQKGLSKTFEQMTQGEQVMLRYQYMMEATADAQGDFARTADGYANSTRSLEANFDALKTNIGGLVKGPLNDLLNAVNSLFDTETKRRTVLDDINDIQIETDEKIAKIRTIAEQAHSLKVTLDTIGGSDAGEVVNKIASGANILNSSAPNTWKSLATALRNVNGLENIFKGTDAKDNIEALAQALSSSDVDTDKAGAWKAFLGALSENAEAVSQLTGKDAEETAKWLDELGKAADSLDPADADAWDTLLTTLVSGFDLNTTEGKKFVDSLAAQFLALGTDSKESVEGLTMLGFSTDQIAEKQEEWLKTCKDLVRTIPGLSEIVNTETGEIKGGTGALEEYVDEWRRSQEKIIKWRAYYRMREELDEANGGLYKKELTMKAAYRLVLEENPFLDPEEVTMADIASGSKKDYDGIYFDKFVEAYNDYESSVYGAAQSTKLLDAVYAELTEEFGEMSEEEANAATTFEGWSDSAKQAAQSIISDVSEAMGALEEYVNGVHDSVTGAIDSVVKGFEKVETPMMRNRDKVRDLTRQIDGLDSSSKTYAEDLAKLQDELNKANSSKVSAQNMGYNLQQQAEWMDTYLKNLRLARENGVSDEVLAALADGSEESYDYLEALATASAGEVEIINANYAAVAEKKKELSDELTAQQLKVDETYLSLAEKAKQAVESLDMAELAAENTGKTVAGMAQGIASNVPEVQAAVDDVLAQLNRLESFGISIDLGQFGTIQFSGGNGVKSTHKTPGGFEYVAEGSFRTGTDWIPHDNFLARLHEGEAVLTAEENKIWQAMKNGSISDVDYDAIGGVMRDNVKPGGNVYLDGKIVGAVVSDRQGQNYRSLQRSGWQK